MNRIEVTLYLDLSDAERPYVATAMSHEARGESYAEAVQTLRELLLDAIADGLLAKLQA